MENKNITSKNAFNEVRNFNKEQLTSLLKECREIGKLEAPRYAKQSKELKQLFELEKEPFYSWSDQFSNVKQAIEIEILARVRNDVW